MDNTQSPTGNGFRLTLDGSMTLDFANELEDKIIAAMRQHKNLEVDLSGVSEIDLCGIHLINLLQTVGGKAVKFVATSPIVERAVKGLLTLPACARSTLIPASLLV
jgi:ABC-type transporter Mla MlaB component